MENKKKSWLTTQEMSVVAVLAAVASILFLLEIPIVLFYKLDFSNLPVLLGTFSLGPVAGITILFIKSLLGLLHSTSQGVGELADFLVGFAMVLPAGLIYWRKRTRQSAIWGMGIGAAVATVVSVLANMYIMIPFYGAVYNMPTAAIVDMGQALIPSLDSLWKFVFYITAPFNLLKWVLISIMGTLMYKPLSPLLHGRRKRVAEKE